MNKVTVKWSETFSTGASLEDVQQALNTALEDISEYQIYGIDLVEKGGLQRFWIYY